VGSYPHHPAPLILLPTTAADPERTHALIVGIERYAAGASWDLNGPLNDALAIRQWLLDCGVPTTQIHLHASVLESNQAKLSDLQAEQQEATDQALRKSIERLKTISHSQAEVLLVFWAGHGLISAEHQCLMLADATYADMACYRVDNLRASFANENCLGFAQQIFLFDTCRSFHTKPGDPPPGLALPVGPPSARRQFLFFASQEGQAAINLGPEQCGLFTKVLLEQLQRAQQLPGTWPPEMESIATSVQQVFAKQQWQYPVYKILRDWQGNERIDPFPVDTAPAHANDLSFSDALDQLAVLLAKHLGLPRQRDDVLQNLRLMGEVGSEVYQNAGRRDSPKDDYLQLLSTCLEYQDQGSLLLLRSVTAKLLGKKTSAKLVDQAFKALLNLLALNGSAHD
jgi:hypothetical protein